MEITSGQKISNEFDLKVAYFSLRTDLFERQQNSLHAMMVDGDPTIFPKVRMNGKRSIDNLAIINTVWPILYSDLSFSYSYGVSCGNRGCSIGEFEFDE